MIRRAFVLISLLVGCTAPSAERGPSEGDTETDGAAIATVKSGFVTVKRDVRKCAYPMCGGWFVTPAETTSKLRCADGTAAASCYVPALDLTAIGKNTSGVSGVSDAIGTDATTVILFGEVRKTDFAATRAWIAPNAGATKGSLYFVSENHTIGGRKHQGVRLNYSARRTFDAIDFGAAPGSDAQWDSATAAASSDASVILGGAITGPNSSKLFEADQFFLRFVPAAPVTCTDALQTKVIAASTGLLWPSESDYPIDFVSVRGTKTVSVEVARKLAGVPAGAVVEERSFDEWFNHVVTVWDAEDPVAVANAARFRTLKSTLSGGLTGLKVYRFGTIDIRVVIIGRTSCSDVAGIATTVIET